MKNEIKEDFARKSREDWAFAFFLTGVFLVYAGFTTYHHEMWRDELQAWLICRESPTIFDIFQNIRYEGHPFSWFLVIWPFTRLSHDPSIIQWLNLLIAGCAVFLIAKAAPVPQWMRAMVVLGYFPVYEYGSIARNYALSLLLVIAFCVVFPNRRKHPIWLGILFFLAANASLPACVLTLAAVLALSAEAIISPPEISRRIATWGGLGIAICGIVLSALQMLPPPDRSHHTEWFFQFDLNKIKKVLRIVTGSYTPMPTPPDVGFTQIFGLLPRIVRMVWITIGVGLLVLTSLALTRRPVALAYYLLGSLGLLAFFYMRFFGYLRHHGFLFVCFGTALWLSKTIQPITPPRLIDSMSRWAERVISVVFPLLLVVHLAAAGIAAAGEYSQVFSAAKATASLIREKGLEHFGMVAAHDYTATPVVGYLGKDRAYYSDGGRYGSYTVWDENRLIAHNIWEDADRLTKQNRAPVVVLIDNKVLQKSPPPSELLNELQLVGCRGSDIVTQESYCVYLIGRDVH